MRKADKVILLAIGIGILINLAKEKFLGTHKNEIIIAGHHVNKAPCLGAVNELLGNAVDSVKVCDCALPKYYELIRNNPEKVKEFEDAGFLGLQGEKDSSMIIFRDCIVANIIDTTYKMNLRKYRQVLVKQFNDSITRSPYLNMINADTFSNCIISRLDRNVTIKEYFSKSYYDTDSLNEILNGCIKQSIIKK